VFNVVFHNRDDHPKNHAFRLNRNRQWDLSPAYDLTYSSGPGGEHHMDIDGEGKAPGRDHLLRLAAKTDIKAPVANRIIGEVTQVASTLRARAADLPIRRQTVEELVAKSSKL
jgi:serine/threonine-protein kinase HipA